MIDWKPGQLNAIEDKGGNLIVSASAGSGKTSAMVERVLRLIKEGTPVKRILLLTFGEAAAAEMKDKLLNSLIEYVKEAKEDKDFIREQIDDLAIADISTIHGYCKRIIIENFEAAGVSPGFEIADEETAAVLAIKAIKNLIEKENKAGQIFFVTLRDMLSSRNDDVLINIIFTLYKHMATHADRYDWLESRFKSEYLVDIEESEAAKYIVASIRSEAVLLSKRVSDFQKRAQYLNEAIYINNSCSMFERVSGYVEIKSLKDCYLERARERVSKWRKLMGDAKNSVLYESAQNLKDEVKAFEDYVSCLLGDCDYVEAERIRKGSGDQVAELVRLVKGFDKEYSQLKLENNVLDFSDLEKFALQVLTDPKRCEEIVKDHDYVFVDEYQDTNYVQESIINKIARTDSLFVVGDSKQCIYRFRLAEPEIFLDRLKEYKTKNRAVYFKDNFRSAPAILGFVNEVFNVLMSESFGGVDYKAEAFNMPEEYHKVSSYPEVEICAVTGNKNDEGEEDAEIAAKGVYSVRDAEQFSISAKGIAEGKLIAEKIISLVGKEHIATKDGIRLIEFDDITLMFKQRSNAKGILSELVAAGIPLRLGAFAVSQKSDDIAQLIDYLRFLDNPCDDYLLLAAMRSRFGLFSNEELADIRKKEKNGVFYEAVNEAAKSDDFLGQKLRDFYKRADDYRFRAEFTELSELTDLIIAESGYSDYLLTLTSGKDRLIALRYFIAALKGKSYSRSLAAFSFYFAEHGEDIEWGKGDLSAESGVNVSTIHASKGLEYPIVILAGTGCSMLKSNKSSGVVADNVLGIGSNFYDAEKRIVSPSIVLNAIAAKKKLEEREDALRLLYVALTRAKSHLIITGETTSNRLEKTYSVQSSASYLDWLLCAAKSSNVVEKLITEYTVNVDKSINETEKPVLFGKSDKTVLKKIEEELSYSYPYRASIDLGIKYTATGINREETEIAPLFEEVRRIKGIDYHKIMQYIDYGALTVSAIKSELERMEKEMLITPEESGNIEASEILMCLSSPIMRYAATAQCLKERRFMLAVPASEIKPEAPDEEILIQGTIDLIILGEKNIIVDFKHSVLPESVLRDKYRKQLEIYKKAVEEAMNIKVDLTALYVFGSNKTIIM